MLSRRFEARRHPNSNKGMMTGQPLAKVYVKVYAQMQDNRVEFYKDGYTDLRGRFASTSLSTNQLDFVKKSSGTGLVVCHVTKHATGSGFAEIGPVSLSIVREITVAWSK